jgi:hypothetical protein
MVAPKGGEIYSGYAEDANIILRFQTLKRLLDEGLVTRDEYNQRRGANLGALLRYSAAAPTAGLGRPAPTPDQVVERLKFLAAAYEEKSITAREQKAERTVILDALLPASAFPKADPPANLTDQMQAAQMVGRLERLNAANVISAEEQERERAAVFRVVQTSVADSEAAARAAAGLAAAQAANPTGPGVWLGTYRNENQAKLAWASLQLTHSSELNGLQQVVTKVGTRRRGYSYRLNAGPIADTKAAAALCNTLRAKRQFCRPVTLGK